MASMKPVIPQRKVKGRVASFTSRSCRKDFANFDRVLPCSDESAFSTAADLLSSILLCYAHCCSTAPASTTFVDKQRIARTAKTSQCEEQQSIYMDLYDHNELRQRHAALDEDEQQTRDFLAQADAEYEANRARDNVKQEPDVPEDAPTCRICFGDTMHDPEMGRLFSPCLCEFCFV